MYAGEEADLIDVNNDKKSGGGGGGGGGFSAPPAAAMPAAMPMPMPMPMPTPFNYPAPNGTVRDFCLNKIPFLWFFSPPDFVHTVMISHWMDGVTVMKSWHLQAWEGG